MAAGDYRSCDVCGGKAFYDANLSYEEGPRGVPYRMAGEEQYADPAVSMPDEIVEVAVWLAAARAELGGGR